jgi:hypothetical protein
LSGGSRRSRGISRSLFLAGVLRAGRVRRSQARQGEQRRQRTHPQQEPFHRTTSLSRRIITWKKQSPYTAPKLPPCKDITELNLFEITGGKLRCRQP